MIIDHFYDADKNTHWYHLGYTSGETYQKFYLWHQNRPLKYGYDNMPHDFWVYRDDQDRLELHLTWADCIPAPIMRNLDTIDGWHDFTQQSHSESQDIFDILQQCISEEINREILTKISKSI